MFGAAGSPRDCPCGSGEAYAACCATFVEDGAPPPTALALMRSRYTAYALRRSDHLFRTWHPRTRPEDLETDPSVQWQGLNILATQDGEEGDDTGLVEFSARWQAGAQRGLLTERSHFARRAGRWVYVGPETSPDPTRDPREPSAG